METGKILNAPERMLIIPLLKVQYVRLTSRQIHS